MVNFSGEVAALIPGHNKAIDITQMKMDHPILMILNLVKVL